VTAKEKLEIVIGAAACTERSRNEPRFRILARQSFLKENLGG